MEDFFGPASPISSSLCCSVPPTCTLIVVASKVPMYGEMTELELTWAQVCAHLMAAQFMFYGRRKTS